MVGNSMAKKPGRKPSSNPRGVRIGIRFTDGQHQELLAAAHEEGLDLSPMLRSIILKWLRERKASQESKE